MTGNSRHNFLKKKMAVLFLISVTVVGIRRILPSIHEG